VFLNSRHHRHSLPAGRSLIADANFLFALSGSNGSIFSSLSVYRPHATPDRSLIFVVCRHIQQSRTNNPINRERNNPCSHRGIVVSLPQTTGGNNNEKIGTLPIFFVSQSDHIKTAGETLQHAASALACLALISRLPVRDNPLLAILLKCRTNWSYEIIRVWQDIRRRMHAVSALVFS